MVCAAVVCNDIGRHLTPVLMSVSRTPNMRVESWRYETFLLVFERCFSFARCGRALIHISVYLTVCSVRYKLGDARCDDVWLKYDGKGSFLLIGELETSPIWLASARHSGLSSEDKNTS